jgi:hypothetical protein
MMVKECGGEMGKNNEEKLKNGFSYCIVCQKFLKQSFKTVSKMASTNIVIIKSTFSLTFKTFSPIHYKKRGGDK